MIEYWIVYSQADGAFQWKSSGPLGSAQFQEVPPTMAIMVLPYQAFIALPGDLAPLKQAVIDNVNLQAGNFRKLHITDIPGQQATYLEKMKDAEAWFAAGKPADLTIYPYLEFEAQQTGQTAEFVATDIVTVGGLWRQADARIEGKRRGLSVEILAANSIKDIVTPAVFDWPTLIADILPPTPQENHR